MGSQSVDEQFLLEEWDAYPQEELADLAYSMRNRCYAVIGSEGHKTGY